ncbi:MAG: hypothetical protein E7621_07050 [Ruminococcaceae bacterium]|nr:hypothetical protein [Oscillospiraceae bacterium]
MTDQKTIITIIFVVFAGICYGTFYAYYHRRLVGDLIRAILCKNALNEQSAVTLEDVGYSKGIKRIFAKFALKKGSAARKYVCAVYEEKAPVKKHDDELFVKCAKPDKEQKYYVPEEKRHTVERKYNGKGMSLASVLIAIAVLFAAALVAISILPWILANANRLGGTSSGELVENSDVSQTQTENSENSSMIETISPFSEGDNN